MPHFKILLILYIDLLNISWVKKNVYSEEYGSFKGDHFLRNIAFNLYEIPQNCVGKMKKYEIHQNLFL